MTAGLLLLLVPKWGGVGAAWVTTMTYATLALASLLSYLPESGLSAIEFFVPTSDDIRVLSSSLAHLLNRAKPHHI
jgi:O-antigen/teichoic acid export membrane protein